jgi:hypothetical protein
MGNGFADHSSLIRRGCIRAIIDRAATRKGAAESHQNKWHLFHGLALPLIGHAIDLQKRWYIASLGELDKHIIVPAVSLVILFEFRT